MTAKIHGQRNPFTVIQAVFAALAKHESAEVTAMKLGRSLQEMQRINYLRK